MSKDNLSAGFAVVLYQDHENETGKLGSFILKEKDEKRVGKMYILEDMPENSQIHWRTEYWKVVPVKLTQLGLSTYYPDKFYPIRTVCHIGISPTT